MNTELHLYSHLFTLEETLAEELLTCKKECFQKGEIILRQNSYVKSIPLVVGGSLRVYKQTEDREILFYHIPKGTTCGMSLAACLEQKTLHTEVSAAQTSEVLLVPSSKVLSWQMQYASWNRFIIRAFTQRQLELIENYGDLAFSKMDQRIKDYLCNLIRETTCERIVITHQEIANELGTTRVVISRILKAMELKGAIELLRGAIRVKHLVCRYRETA